MRSGSDTDGGDAELVGHPARRLGGHHLEDDGEGPRVLHGARVVEQPLELVAAALDDVAAQTVLALGGEADVGHDRDAGTHDPVDLVGAPHTALALHRMHP